MSWLSSTRGFYLYTDLSSATRFAALTRLYGGQLFFFFCFLSPFCIDGHRRRSVAAQDIRAEDLI